MWPAIFLGAFVVNVTTAGSVATSVGIATGNTLEGFLGAFLVNYFAHGRKVFAQQRDTLSFVLLAAVLSTTVSVTSVSQVSPSEGTQSGRGTVRFE